jgi:hypothetical protein
MTVLDWWHGMDGAMHYRVNDCLHTVVTRAEACRARDAEACASLAIARVTPLVWLAMPGHEVHREAPESEGPR